MERGIRERKHRMGCELQKCSSFQSQDKLWSDFKKLFSSYLLQLRGARRREELTKSYFMGLSLSSRELQHCFCLKPLEQGWHSSTLSRFLWLSQQLPIKRYLPGSLRAAEEMMKGWDEEEERSGSKKKWVWKSDDARQPLQPGYRLDLGFSISISVIERAARRGIKNRISGMSFMLASFDLFPAFGKVE